MFDEASSRLLIPLFTSPLSLKIIEGRTTNKLHTQMRVYAALDNVNEN